MSSRSQARDLSAKSDEFALQTPPSRRAVSRTRTPVAVLNSALPSLPSASTPSSARATGFDLGSPSTPSSSFRDQTSSVVDGIRNRWGDDLSPRVQSSPRIARRMDKAGAEAAYHPSLADIGPDSYPKTIDAYIADKSRAQKCPAKLMASVDRYIPYPAAIRSNMFRLQPLALRKHKTSEERARAYEHAETLVGRNIWKFLGILSVLLAVCSLVALGVITRQGLFTAFKFRKLSLFVTPLISVYLLRWGYVVVKCVNKVRADLVVLPLPRD